MNTSTKSPLCIGLWGCGGMGRSLAQALLATGEARLAAAYDLQPEAASAAADAYGAKAMDSAEALLAYPGLDGVMIALPPDLHAPSAVRAAKAGLHLFVEKPMSVNVAGCREILQAVQRCGVKLMVGQVLRYYEPYRTIRRWLAEGRFGRLYAAAIWRIIDGHHMDRTSWRVSHARSGGYLLTVGVHELDMLRCLLGQPQTIAAISLGGISSAGCTLSAGCTPSAQVSEQGGEWADYLAVQVRFAAGGAATYEGGAGSYAGRYGFRLYFEQATLFSEEAFDRHALQVYGTDGRPIAIAEHEFSSEQPVEAELHGWLKALRGEAAIPIPGEEGLASVALAEAAYRAAESGQIVDYKEE